MECTPGGCELAPIVAPTPDDTDTGGAGANGREKMLRPMDGRASLLRWVMLPNGVSWCGAAAGGG
eukprot:3306845-Rhodomonas_salina.1